MTRYDLIEHGYTQAQAGSAMHTLMMLCPYTKTFDDRAKRQYRSTYDVITGVAISAIENYLSANQTQNHRSNDSIESKTKLLNTLKLIKETHDNQN